MDWERLSEIYDRRRAEQVTAAEQAVLAQYWVLSEGFRRLRRRWPVSLLVASVVARLEPRPRLAWRWALGAVAGVVLAAVVLGILQITYTQEQQARYQQMVVEFGAVSGNEAALARLVSYPK
ncbi:MAG: hypothetical protein HY335_00750 [Deinococcus sp.]|nr:hypothetical protein [Deinococcus sp.]